MREVMRELDDGRRTQALPPSDMIGTTTQVVTNPADHDLRDNPDKQARPTRTLVSLDRLREPEPSKSLITPVISKIAETYDTVCRSPRAILISKWITGVSAAVIAGTLAVAAWSFMPTAEPGPAPRPSTSYVTVTPSAKERPAPIVEPKLPTPPPPPLPTRTRRTTQAAEPTRSSSPEPSKTPKPPVDLPTELPTQEPPPQEPPPPNPCEPHCSPPPSPN